MRVLRPGRVGLAWLTAVGVDLFFNAGVFAFVYEQSREPALLPDSDLAMRIPVAYAALALAVTALAWLLQTVDARDGRAIKIGAGAGLVLGAAGFGAMWTAVDVTGLLIGVGILVSAVEGAAAAAVLTSERQGSGLRIRVAVAFVLLAGVGQVIANLTN
ncbi:MAG: hypothetical protein WB239_04760 [Acidimicrobiia bacterium]